MRTLALLALFLVGSDSGMQILDGEEQRRLALAFEREEKWSEALEAWERVLDRCEVSSARRQEAMKSIKPLRERLPAWNEDPRRARSWRAVFVVFEELDLTVGKGFPSEKNYRTSVSAQDLERIETSIAKFRDQVFRSTSGIVNVAWEIVRVKEPLTDLAGDARGGFWVDPQRALRFVPDQTELNPYESVFTYVKMNDGKDVQVPIPFWGGTYGGDSGIHGAGYTAICWSPQAEPDGELEFHEWMHQVDWMFAAVLGYPDEFVPNPDSGKRQGEAGGDPCYRRPLEEQNWMGFYRHIAEEHITRLMWSEAGMFETPTCPIRPNDIERWLAIGPFREEGIRSPLQHPFLGESGLIPQKGAPGNGKSWKELESEGRVLDLGKAFGTEPGSVAYAFVRVQSPVERESMLLLGSDDGVRVWVNGKLVHTVDLPRVMQFDLDRVRVSLNKGWNSLLFKVENRGGGWFLQARFVDAEWLPLRDLQYE